MTRKLGACFPLGDYVLCLYLEHADFSTAVGTVDDVDHLMSVGTAWSSGHCHAPAAVIRQLDHTTPTTAVIKLPDAVCGGVTDEHTASEEVDTDGARLPQ